MHFSLKIWTIEFDTLLYCICSNHDSHCTHTIWILKVWLKITYELHLISISIRSSAWLGAWPLHRGVVPFPHKPGTKNSLNFEFLVFSHTRSGLETERRACAPALLELIDTTTRRVLRTPPPFCLCKGSAPSRDSPLQSDPWCEALFSFSETQVALRDWFQTFTEICDSATSN